MILDQRDAASEDQCHFPTVCNMDQVSIHDANYDLMTDFQSNAPRGSPDHNIKDHPWTMDQNYMSHLWCTSVSLDVVLWLSRSYTSTLFSIVAFFQHGPNEEDHESRSEVYDKGGHRRSLGD